MRALASIAVDDTGVEAPREGLRRIRRLHRVQWSRLREEVAGTAARLAERLRAAPDPGRPLRRVGWTPAELGAHLASLPGRYRAMLDGPVPVPPSLSADNRAAIERLRDRDPAALLVTEVDGLLSALGDDGERPVHYFTAPHTAAGLAGIMLTELLVHGRDLCDADGSPWPIGRAHAVACLRGVLPAVVVAVDRAAAARATGVYHVSLRGGDDWTFRVDGGAVTVTRERPGRADLRLSADPVVFLLNGYGLVGNARAALTGGVVAYGRKPWLASRFGALFRET